MLSSNQQRSTATGTTIHADTATRQRAVLLVDDEGTLRSALRRFFMRRGWQVIEAEDGEEARALLLGANASCSHVDAILTDMRMPRLSGIELHTLVAQADARLAGRFIFSSGDTGDAEAVEFIRRTGCPVISKPFELAALLAAVERIADREPVPAN
jgi:DNA-binding NtrC family response regulator